VCGVVKRKQGLGACIQNSRGGRRVASHSSRRARPCRTALTCTAHARRGSGYSMPVPIGHAVPRQKAHTTHRVAHRVCLCGRRRRQRRSCVRHWARKGPCAGLVWTVWTQGVGTPGHSCRGMGGRVATRSAAGVGARERGGAFERRRTDLPSVLGRVGLQVRYVLCVAHARTFDTPLLPPSPDGPGGRVVLSIEYPSLQRVHARRQAGDAGLVGRLVSPGVAVLEA
jgi:hypothetical protein